MGLSKPIPGRLQSFYARGPLPVLEHFAQQSFDGQRRRRGAVPERRRRGGGGAAEEGELDGARRDGLQQRQDEQQPTEAVVRGRGGVVGDGRGTTEGPGDGRCRQPVLSQHRLRLVLIALHSRRVSQVTQLCTRHNAIAIIRYRPTFGPMTPLSGQLLEYTPRYESHPCCCSLPLPESFQTTYTVPGKNGTNNVLSITLTNTKV